MQIERILSDLQVADSSEAKAALVAEAVIDDLPSQFKKTALRCGFLYWFNFQILKALLEDADEGIKQEGMRIITSLPFVEVVPNGYAFHVTTRQGLIAYYSKKDPDEIIDTYNAILPVLLEDQKDNEAAVMTIYGLVATGKNREAISRLDELLSRFASNGEFTRIVGLFDLLDEAMKLPFVKEIELSAFHLHLFGLAKSQVGSANQAISLFDQAISLYPDEPTKGIAYSNRGLVYANLGDNEKAVSDFNQAIRLLPDGSDKAKTYHNLGNVYLAKGDLDLAFSNQKQAINLLPSIADQSSAIPPFILPPIYEDLASSRRKFLTILLRPTNDKIRDNSRIRQIYGTLITFRGNDRFAFHVFEQGRGYLIEFPNFTTNVTPELINRLTAFIEKENIRVEEITFQ